VMADTYVDHVTLLSQSVDKTNVHPRHFSMLKHFQN
jgi:hypothetical protein